MYAMADVCEQFEQNFRSLTACVARIAANAYERLKNGDYCWFLKVLLTDTNLRAREQF